MPGRTALEDAGRKRKHGVESSKPRKAPKKSSSENIQADILLLEEQILESREHYNNIVALQQHIDDVDKKPQAATLAAVALCRAFCRLIAGEKLVKRKEDTEADVQVLQWLKLRLRDYVQSLVQWIGNPDATKESTALTLLMRIVKEETRQGGQRAEQAWRGEKSTFVTLVSAMLDEEDAEGARDEFVEKFVEEHDDVRFFTFMVIKQLLAGAKKSELHAGNALDLLSRIENTPTSEDQIEDWYGQAPETKNHQLQSLATHRKIAQECWLALFRARLNAAQRKRILQVTTAQILPWFPNRAELLTDFLTDSFNAGGSVSLLALSGIFHLMTKNNIDYPSFYPKLYSLLDEDILHSKHRSRFFRLLQQFLSSTHLPAALVASFIKRLARLSLQAPPGAIVWIVPWTYNLLKSHPACTFMLHRAYHPAHAIYAAHPKYQEEGMDDPYDAAESDPSFTGAIDSSLWELETLRTHWHPNVATLAKIMGEQFTKRDYQLEDFLDHSYATLIDAELGKEVKKKPEVEFEIPKRIVTAEGDGLNDIGNLLERALEA